MGSELTNHRLCSNMLRLTAKLTRQLDILGCFVRGPGKHMQRAHSDNVLQQKATKLFLSSTCTSSYLELHKFKKEQERERAKISKTLHFLSKK